MTRLLDKAVSYVDIRLRRKMYRGSHAAYMAHVLEAFKIVVEYGGKEPCQIAAILHDVLFDTTTSQAELEAEFTTDVAQIVGKLTEDKDKTWRERKEATAQKMTKCCQGIAIVQLADKISNLRSYVRQMKDLGFWYNFTAGYTDQLWFYQTFIRAGYQNTRLTQKPEYTELKTEKALDELLCVFNEFRAGLQWTPHGVKMGDPGGVAWAKE